MKKLLNPDYLVPIITGLISAVITGVVSATVFISNTTHTTDDLKARVGAVEQRLDKRDERDQKRDELLSQINAKVEVLLDRTDPNRGSYRP
jgi:hypothetical protein